LSDDRGTPSYARLERGISIQDLDTQRMMIKRGGELLRWDDAVGIVGIIGGVLGATLVGIEHYIPAIVGFYLSALIFALCSIVSNRHWIMRAVSFVLAMAMIYLGSATDHYRIQKTEEMFQQTLRSQRAQQLTESTARTVEEIKTLLLGNRNQTTPTSALQTFIESKKLEEKYPLGYALFYTDGRTPPLYFKQRAVNNNISFDPSNLRVTELTSNRMCFDWPDVHATHICLTGRSGAVFPMIRISDVQIEGELLGNATDGAAWVIGMRKVS
jgi:hypothetical protein